MSGGLFNGQEHLASLLADYLGVAPIPVTRVESACASGALALKTGIMDVAMGLNEIVLVGGVEKMNDVNTDEATYALASAADQEFEVYQGITFPGLYAMMARRHMEKYGTTREQLAEVAVKNHFHGSMNPLAQFPQKITVEAVMNSVMIAEPLRILDCSPITDGAAALIICPLDLARKISKKPAVKISGFGHATDSIALHSRPDLTDLRATTLAAQQALKMADASLDKIDLMEVHDCFTIAEICVLEALGVAEKGKGATLNNQAIHVSKVDDPSISLLTTGFPFRSKDYIDLYLESFKRLFFKMSGVRRLGAVALDFCYLAAGRAEGFWEIGLSPWDVAAGYLILREAGGEMTDFAGGDEPIWTGNVVASNGLIHNHILEVVQDVFKGHIEK